MPGVQYEGRVHNGQIQLAGNVYLPENARVIVVVASTDEARAVRLRSPRLTRRDDASRFLKEVTEEPPHAAI